MPAGTEASNAKAGASGAEFPVDKKLPEYLSDGRLGSERSFSNLQAAGEVLIVNFWATWCPPCIEELPSLELLHRQLSKAGVPNARVVAVSVDEGIQPITELFKSLQFKPSFAVLLDRSGPFAQQLGTQKFPETYLIRPDGRIGYRWVGPQDWLSSEVIEMIAAEARPRSE